MNRIAYPAKLTYSRQDKEYLAEFPDLEGCLTSGGTKDEALVMAGEALSGYLASIFESGFPIPAPSKLKGKNIYYIEPEVAVATSIMLRQIREEQHLSQEDIAKKLHISYQAYQKLEHPLKANPTLKTLEKMAEVLDRKLVVEFV